MTMLRRLVIIFANKYNNVLHNTYRACDAFFYAQKKPANADFNISDLVTALLLLLLIHDTVQVQVLDLIQAAPLINVLNTSLRYRLL